MINICNNEKVSVKFIGENTNQVTGSKILVEYMGTQILLDYGLTQGHGNVKDYKNNTRLNNQLAPSKIDFVILGEAHADHSCLIPSLYKHGFDGKIIQAEGIKHTLYHLWTDSAYLSNKTAQFLNRTENIDKYKPYYTRRNIKQAQDNTIEIGFYDYKYLTNEIRLKLLKAGHIKDSSIAVLEFKDGNNWKRLVYTGDLGSGKIPHQFVDSRDTMPNANVVIAESTYSSRTSSNLTPKLDRDKLIANVKDTLKAGGKVVIPSFSLHRTPEILSVLYDGLYDFRERFQVYLDSPLSISLYNVYKKDYDKLNKIDNWSKFTKIKNSKASKALTDKNEPCVIVASSGMAVDYTRVSYHIASIIENRKNSLIKIGYAGVGTPLEKIYRREELVDIMDYTYRNNCMKYEYNSFTSHIQYEEMLDIYTDVVASDGFFLVHGNNNTKESFIHALSEVSDDKCNSTKYINPERNQVVKF